MYKKKFQKKKKKPPGSNTTTTIDKEFLPSSSSSPQRFRYKVDIADYTSFHAQKKEKKEKKKKKTFSRAISPLQRGLIRYSIFRIQFFFLRHIFRVYIK